MSKELKLRIISAVILASIVLLITWLGGQWFVLLWAVAAILILLEFARISSSSQHALPRLAAIACLVLILATWISAEKHIALIMFAVGFVTLCIWEGLLQKTIWAAIGLAYAALPFFTITELRGSANDSLLAVIILFACVWGADIFAYIAGRSIGGPKLAPKISPNKTWAGFIGSLFGAVILSFIVVCVAGYGAGFGLFLLVLVLAVISQIGDLVESSVKRKFDIKDSGTIIPGHGGVLDRIDGLIFSGILFWAILWIIQMMYGLINPMPEVFVNWFLKI